MASRFTRSLALPLALVLPLAAGALTLPSHALAQPTTQNSDRANWKSLATIATSLAENGYRVLELELERDGFEAELIDRDGNLVKADINPVSGALQHIRNRGRSTVANDPQWKTLPQVASQLEAKGYLVRKLETEHDGFEAELTSQDGQRLEARIDPKTGEIISSERD